MPERIRENRESYVAALRASDREWDHGQLNISDMESFLARLLIEQLTEAREDS